MSLLDLLDSYDKSLMLYLNYDGGSWLDSFWYTYSGKFIWIGVYAFILIKFFMSCRTQGKVDYKALLILVLCTAAIIAMADQVASGIIKHAVERPRPSHSPEIQDMLHYVNNYRGGRFGFVSSHAANSIGLTVWLSLLFRSWIFRGTIFIWSILTCYSRIYLGVHYPGDILGGLLVGICSALLIHYLYRRFTKQQHQIPAEKREPWIITLAVFATVVLIAAFA